MLGEEVLGLDGLPVLDAAKVADDDHLIESANLLVQPPDLLDHLLRCPQETQLFFDALVISDMAPPLHYTAGVEAIASGCQLFLAVSQRIDRRGVEIQEIAHVPFGFCPDLLLIFIEINEPNETDVGRVAPFRTRLFIAIDPRRINRLRYRPTSCNTEAAFAGSDKTSLARPH